MTNRREFLQAAAALSAAPLVGRVAFGSGRTPVTLDAIVLDSRHAAGRAFGACAERLGVPLRAIAGDITDLWQHHLRKRFGGAPVAIAGLTERPALFLLERLAWDHGLRVVFEAEHEPDDRGCAVHRLMRSADPRLALELDAAGPAWPAVLADALIDGSRVPAREFGPTDSGLAARLDEPMTLYSWIIAPRTAI